MVKLCPLILTIATTRRTWQSAPWFKCSVMLIGIITDILFGKSSRAAAIRHRPIPALHCAAMLRVPCWYRQLTADLSETYQGAVKDFSLSIAWVLNYLVRYCSIPHLWLYSFSVEWSRGRLGGGGVEEENPVEMLHFVAVNMTEVKWRRGNINPPQHEKKEYGYMLIWNLAWQNNWAGGLIIHAVSSTLKNKWIKSVKLFYYFILSISYSVCPKFSIPRLWWAQMTIIFTWAVALLPLNNGSLQLCVKGKSVDKLIFAVISLLYLNHGHSNGTK